MLYGSSFSRFSTVSSKSLDVATSSAARKKSVDGIVARSCNDGFRHSMCSRLSCRGCDSMKSVQSDHLYHQHLTAESDYFQDIPVFLISLKDEQALEF